MSSPTPLLEISGVSAFYGKIQALREVDLVVERGEIVTLVGANGAGKSTLMMSWRTCSSARCSAIPPISTTISSACCSCSRCCAPAPASVAALCREASSRCWPSAAH